MKKLFLLFLLLLIPTTFGQFDSQNNDESSLDLVSRLTGIPEEEIETFPKAMQNVILPTLAVMIGIMFALEVTQEKYKIKVLKDTPAIKSIISVTIGLSAISTGILWKVVSPILKVAPVIATLIFLFIVFGGIAYLGFEFRNKFMKNKKSLNLSSSELLSQKHDLENKLHEVEFQLKEFKQFTGPLTPQQQKRFDELKTLKEEHEKELDKIETMLSKVKKPSNNTTTA